MLDRKLEGPFGSRAILRIWLVLRVKMTNILREVVLPFVSQLQDLDLKRNIHSNMTANAINIMRIW